MSEFFSRLDMPNISADEQKMTDAPLRLSKITDTIKSMHNAKERKAGSTTRCLRITMNLDLCHLLSHRPPYP